MKKKPATPKEIKDYTEAMKNFHMPARETLTLKKKRKLPVSKKIKRIIPA